MKDKVTTVREWIGRAKRIYENLIGYEQALKSLEDVCGVEPIARRCEILRAQESAARMEIYEVLSKADLTPRQYSILNLHYLQYESWTRIADRLHIDRRYALKIHIQALERLAEQLDDSFELVKLTA